MGLRIVQNELVKAVYEAQPNFLATAHPQLVHRWPLRDVRLGAALKWVDLADKPWPDIAASYDMSQSRRHHLTRDAEP